MGTAYKELFKLYDLIQNGDVSSVRNHMQEKSIDTNVILPSKGIGVLHLAVGVDPEDKSNECTEILLEHGGNPNLCNEDGVTPVHIAAIWGRVDNIKLLIKHGGDPTLRDLEGLSAFDYAVRDEQWDVYDCLHSLISLNGDDDDVKCSYTLELDKILLNTDQIVAEYKPLQEDSTRKSELVRDWCDKNTVTVNKLYPTILSETYYIDDVTCPWQDTNITLDLTRNTTCSFKTCQSKRDIEISGILPLENEKRKSIYENFSLPGSPNNITHKNYNNKSSLRRKFPKLSISSIISSDRSLDKAMAIVQNRTNEWLSNDESRTCNTRRSSASSGVSSNYSGGSIVLANVQEEYKYEDKEHDVVLIEKRLLVSPIILPVEEASDGSPDQSVLSIASSLPTSVVYDDDSLRAALLSHGYNPGPITPTTRTLYLKKFQTLNKTYKLNLVNPLQKKNNENLMQKKTFSIELEKSLRSEDWLKDLIIYKDLENKVRCNFNDKKCKKTSFTYLLLDPRLTDNLPAKQGTLTNIQMWNNFVNSIFYIGKGTRARPYDHLYKALSLWKAGDRVSDNVKFQQILDIWNERVGVICLHILQNVTSEEAFTYEAAMIDTIGLTNLKNMIHGKYYGVANTWPHKERRMLGLYLLYNAMKIFIVEGERQLRPDDL